MLYTLIPAAFVGAIPVEIVKNHNLGLLPLLLLVVGIIWAISVSIFYWGLRRYESGSAINVNM